MTYYICPKADECKGCGWSSHQKPHIKYAGCAASPQSPHGCPACVPYRLRVGDRVRTLLGDVGEINELTYNNESAKVYDKSGRLVVHCLLTDLEYLPIDRMQIYNKMRGNTLEPKPTYRWTGKPLTWLDIANESNASISDLFNIITWFDNRYFVLLKKETIDFNDKFINYAIEHTCFKNFLLDKGYIEEVKPDWLLG